MLTDVLPTAVAAGTAAVQGVDAATGLRLMGYSVQESDGTPAAATLNLCHGTDGTTIVAAENLAAAGSVTRWFGPQGLPVADGIFVDRLSGNTTLTILTAIG